jgi:hypothetical protein
MQHRYEVGLWCLLDRGRVGDSSGDGQCSNTRRPCGQEVAAALQLGPRLTGWVQVPCTGLHTGWITIHVSGACPCLTHSRGPPASSGCCGLPCVLQLTWVPDSLHNSINYWVHSWPGPRWPAPPSYGASTTKDKQVSQSSSCASVAKAFSAIRQTSEHGRSGVELAAHDVKQGEQQDQ